MSLLIKRIQRKNIQLMRRELLIRSYLDWHRNSMSPRAQVFRLLIAPFLIGYVARRLARFSFGARLVRVMVPFGSLLLKV